MSHTVLQYCYLQLLILVSRNVRSNIYSHVENLDVTGRDNTGNTSEVPAYFSLISRRQAYRIYVKTYSIFYSILLCWITTLNIKKFKHFLCMLSYESSALSVLKNRNMFEVQGVQTANTNLHPGHQKNKRRLSDNVVANLTPHTPIPKYKTHIFKEEIMTLVYVKEYVFACTVALKLTF